MKRSDREEDAEASWVLVEGSGVYVPDWHLFVSNCFLLLVVRPGAPSSVHAPTRNRLAFRSFNFKALLRLKLSTVGT